MYTFCRRLIVSFFLFSAVALAAQTITYTIVKPASYEDGTAFATEQIVYLVYDADTDKQLFSTFTLTGSNAAIPDTVKCVYAKAGIYNVTNNGVIASTISDPSPSSCKPVPPPPTKKVKAPGFSIIW